MRDWRRVRSLLENVVDLSANDRETYLATACDGAPEIREEVESLLRVYHASSGFLEPAQPASARSSVPASETTPALQPGTRLGAFEILELIGAGGMGQVYRARDTRLDRSVAIKILSPDLAADARGRERFEREARAISRLTHPGICVLHDVARAAADDGVEREFLVMELIGGETLTARLSRGPLSLNHALSCAIQIAEALAAAHARGIVHRDLKPANIMLTKSGVKLLDFGLARLLEPAVPKDAGTAASTLTSVGFIAGTLPYMSPEQVRGEDADARSDLFTFGAVLYEMLCGRRAFEADSRSGLIAMILERDPPRLSALELHLPPALDRLVGTCLAKDPAQRWQDAHDVALELKGIEERQAEPPPRSDRALPRRAAVGWVLAAMLGVSIGWLIPHSMLANRAEAAVPLRLMFDAAPVLAGQAWSPAMSRDGRMVAFLGGPDSGNTFFVRHLDSGVTRHLTTIAGFGCGWSAGWSADGRMLLYAAGEKLTAVDAATGSVSVLAASSSPLSTLDGGVSQSADGTTLLGGKRLQRLAPGERVLRVVYHSDPAVTLQLWPTFLPNGREFLFTQAASDPDRQGVFLGSLNSDRTVRLVPEFSNAAVSASGYLLFGRDASILAQAFNSEGRAPLGEPAVIVSNVLNVSRYTHFALGPDDTIVYVPDHATPTSDLVWYDRDGNAMGKVGAPLAYHQIVMAPDGRRVAVERDDPPAAGSRLGILDLRRGTMLAANPTMAEERGFSEDSNPVWAPDGRRLAFTATIDDEADLFVITPSEPPVRLRRPLMQWAEQWSADGRFLLYTQTDSATKTSLWAMPLEGDRTPFVLVDTPFLNDEAQLSPDGRWLVYGSNESGRFEVYVQRFASRGERWRLSTDGGSQPKWRADGRELFYVAPDGTMMTVAVPQEGEPGQPTALFRTPLRPFSYLDQYAVTPDGQRFLIIAPSQTNESARLMVISNWPALLGR